MMQARTGPLVEQPTRFGPYRVLHLIGRGGMAKVYRCIHDDTKAIVAVKIVLQNHRADENMLRRFGREIEAMKKVSHPYIVPLLDYSLSPEQSYLVMPYFDGGSVADRLNAQLYSPREASQLLTHLAFALDYAHSQGYIHRDLKPSNILLDDKGQTYLSDFGLAKSMDVGSVATGTGQLFGTFAYMAPELADGAPADVRSDVYALGVVLCELVAGHRPFQADQPVSYAYLHRRVMPPSPSQLNPGSPAALDKIVLQALEKSPAKRPQSAGELAQQFSKAVASLPPEQQSARAVTVIRPTLPIVPVGSTPGSSHPAPSGARQAAPLSPDPSTTTRTDPLTMLLIALVVIAVIIFAVLGIVLLTRH